MFESGADVMIRNYLRRLRNELKIRGLSEDRTQEIVAETEGHLTEMLSNASLRTEAAYQQLFEEFGSPQTMAKSIASEYERSASSHRFLWPSLFTLAAALVIDPNLRGGLAGGLVSPSAWPFVLAASLFGAVTLGFLARKPSVGQFIALGFGLIISGTFLCAAASYPVSFSGAGNLKSSKSWGAVSRYGAAEFVADQKKGIAEERQVAVRMKEAKAFFTAGDASRHAPEYLSFQGQYWKPEGLRELTVGVPAERVHSSLLTGSWAEAKQDWTDREPGQAENNADWFANVTTPNDIAQYQKNIDSLNWIKKQPLSLQLRLDLRMVATESPIVCLSGFLATNLGWLLWLLFRTLQRAFRRLRINSHRLSA